MRESKRSIQRITDILLGVYESERKGEREGGGERERERERGQETEGERVRERLP